MLQLFGRRDIEANPATDLVAAIDGINMQKVQDEIEAGMPDLVAATTSNDIEQSLKSVDTALANAASGAVSTAGDPADLSLLDKHTTVSGRMVTFLETRKESLEQVLRATQESLRQTNVALAGWKRLSGDLESGKDPRPKRRKRTAAAQPVSPAPKRQRRRAAPRNQSAPH